MGLHELGPRLDVATRLRADAGFAKGVDDVRLRCRHAEFGEFAENAGVASGVLAGEFEDKFAKFVNR